ncbi:MAG: ABC transporter permease [Planctomycetota bacterium]|jgi:ABC-type lipoprotein release transport system permease subunit
MGFLFHKAWRDVLRFRWAVVGLALLTAIVVTGIAGRARTRATILHTRETLARRLHIADLEVRLVGAHREDARTLAGTPGVAAAETRFATRGTLLRPDARALPAVVHRLPASPPRLHRVEILEGHYPHPGERGVVLDRSLRDLRGFGPGDTVTLALGDHRLSLPVVGIALFADHLVAPMHPEYVLPLRGSLAVVGASHASLRDIPHADRVTSLLLRLEADAAPEAVTEALRAYPRVQIDRIVPASERLDFLLTDLLLQSYDVYAPAVLVMLTVIGLLLLVITLGHVVRSQRRQAGILLAHGFPGIGIASSFSGVAIVAVLLGGGLATLLHAPYARRVAGSLMSPAGFPPLSDPGPPAALLWATGTCLAVALGASLLAGLSLVRLSPARALRPSAWDVGRSRPGRLVRLASRVGVALRLPAAVTLGLTHAARSRGATAAAVVGLGLGFSLVLTCVLVHATHRAEVLGTAKRWSRDATLHFASPAPPEVVAAIATASSGRAEPFVSRVVYTQHGGTGAYRRILGASPAGLAADLPIGEGRGLREGGEALVDAWLAMHEGIAVGDRLALFPDAHAPEGRDVTVVGILEGMSFGRLVVSIDDARALFGLEDTATGVFLTSPLPDRELDALVGDRAEIASVFPTSRVTAEIEAAFEAREIVLWLAVAASIALALLFLAMLAAMDVVVRGPQLAVLHSLGWRDRALGGSIATEVVVRGALAILLAGFTAPFMTRWVIGQMTEAHGYALVPAAPWQVFAVVLGAAIVAMPLGALPAWWAALRVAPTRLLRQIES